METPIYTPPVQQAQVQYHLNARKPTPRMDEGGTIARKAR